MTLYEVWNKKESRVRARKYLVAARDSDQARDLVLACYGPRENIRVRKELALTYPNEAEVRARTTLKLIGWGKRTQKVNCWEIFLKSRRDNKPCVIADYLF